MSEDTHSIAVMDPLDSAMLVPGYLPIDALVLEDDISGRVNKRTAAEISELAQTIMDRGQQVPVEYVIRRRADGGTENVVTKGYGRIAAMRKLFSDGKTWPNGPGVKAILSDRQDQGSWDEIRLDTKIDGLAENIHRHNLKHCDVAAAILELAGPPLNLKDQEIANRLGVTGGYISQHRSYGALIPEVRKEIDSGRLTFRGARKFFRLPEADQRARLQKLEKDATKRRAKPTHKSATRKRGRGAADKLHDADTVETRTSAKTATVTDCRWLTNPRRPLAPADQTIAELLAAILRYAGKPSTNFNTAAKRRAAVINAAEALVVLVAGLSSSTHPVLPGKAKAKKQRTPKPVKPSKPPTVEHRAAPAARSTRRKSKTA